MSGDVNADATIDDGGASVASVDSPAPQWTKIIVIGLTLVGAGLRLLGLGREPLWLDEATTASFAARPFLGAVFAEMQHPPLYNTLTYFVVRLLGESDAALRLPSVVFGIATIPLAWALFRRIFAERHDVALISTALVATSPFLVTISQEARSYALFYCLALASTVVFLRFLRGDGATLDRRSLTIYVILSTLMMYTHYFGVWVLLAHELSYWWHFHLHRRAWVVSRVALIVLFLPWVFWVIHRLSTGSELQAREWIGPIWVRLPYAVMIYLAGYGVGVADTARLDDSASTIFWQEAPVVLPLAFILGWLTLRGLRRLLSTPGHIRTLLVGLLIVPVVALAALSPWMKLVHERYLGFQIVVVLAAMGLGLASLPQRRRRWVSLCCAFCFCFALYAYYHPTETALGYPLRYGKEDWRGAAEWVALQEPDTIILAPSYLELAFDRYYRPPSSDSQPDIALVREGRDELPNLGEAERVVLVLSHEGEAGNRLRARLDEVGERIAEASFPQMVTIRVALYELDP